jgi:hypothetical protein
MVTMGMVEIIKSLTKKKKKRDIDQQCGCLKEDGHCVGSK